MSEVLEKDSNKNVENSGSLLDSIISETNLSQKDDSYGVIKSGVGALIQEMLKTDNSEEKVNKSFFG